MRNSLIALGFILAAGCATAQKACDRVAEADDAYADAMKYLREMGIIEACDAGLEQACKAKKAVLVGQEKLLAAYEVCFEDTP